MSDVRKYFTAGSKRPNKQFSLPDPSGPLSKEIPSSAKHMANKEVIDMLEKEEGKQRQGPHRTKLLIFDVLQLMTSSTCYDP